MEFIPFEFIESVCGHLSQKSLVRIEKNLSKNNFWHQCADRHLSKYAYCRLTNYHVGKTDFQTKKALKKQLKKMENAPPLYRRILEIWIEREMNHDNLITVTKEFVHERLEGRCPDSTGRLYLTLTDSHWVDRFKREIPNLALVFTEFSLIYSGDSSVEFARKTINNGHARCLRLEDEWPEEIRPDVERFMTQRQWFHLSVDDPNIMFDNCQVFKNLLDLWLRDPLTEYYDPWQSSKPTKSLNNFGHARVLRALHPSGKCSLRVEQDFHLCSRLSIEFMMQ